MKKIFVVLILSLFCIGCISSSISGYGVFDLDPGIRVYKTNDITVINITHKEGNIQPNYRDIALILEGLFK